MKKSIGAFVLAAGLGTRLKPWTDHHPKALAMVSGKSLLQRNIEFLQTNGIWHVVVNVHHFADQIVEAIEKNAGWGSDVKISDETAEVLETGGGLLKAAPLLKDFSEVLILNCDILTNLNIGQMHEKHLEKGGLATLAVTHRETSRNLLFDASQQMVGWQNNKTGEVKLPKTGIEIDQCTPMAFSGIHVVSQSIFDKIPFKGKFSMIDLYLELCKTEKIVGHVHSQDLVLDVGKPEAIAQAELLFGS